MTEAPDLSQQPDPRAMEEWKLLQTIIGRQEGLEFQVRGWLLVLLGALVAALFSNTPVISPELFLGVSSLIVLAFGFMELMIRVVKREAIKRVARVEAALRGNARYGYNGPRIYRALSQGPGTRAWGKAARTEIGVLGVWTFYVPLFVVIGIIGASAWFAERARPPGSLAPADERAIRPAMSD